MKTTHEQKWVIQAKGELTVEMIGELAQKMADMGLPEMSTVSLKTDRCDRVEPMTTAVVLCCTRRE